MAKLDDRTRDRARALRREMTDAEVRLWKALREGALPGVRFRRQHPIDRYVVDFACIAHRLIVELDGGQHAGSRRDAVRDARLEELGWTIQRIWNPDVMANLDGVLALISMNLPQGKA